MPDQQIKGEDLRNIGMPQGKAIGLAMKTIEKHFKDLNKQEILDVFSALVKNPEYYLEHNVLGRIADELVVKPSSIIPLSETKNDYAIFGEEHIEQGALDQMNIAMQLPVTIGGALMPDAHQGYGLPIGGVLATDNVVIPYGVGVDIGCRMALSILDIPYSHFTQHESKYKRELIAWTKFGAGSSWEGKLRAQHEVLDKKEFNSTAFVRSLKDKAAEQLGTSGGGNHFVEFGEIEFEDDDPQLNITKGKYLALLTHSGSRGFGATVAGHYTKLAKEICRLPKEAVNLAYLDLDAAEGQEYWEAMTLAGDYASACHEVIHQRLIAATGAQLLAKVENHHNFAWKEKWNGRDVIVHRKGATPASKDILGIIPGSMTAPGFLVRGKGNPSSINSASHGAGRQMSRSQAIRTFSKEDMRRILKEHGVTLVGAGLDESPMAYKDIEKVMASQLDLVDIVARFTPKMVRMASDGSRED